LLKLFVKTSETEIQPGVYFEPKGNNILIFLKKYDPYTATLTMYRSVFVNPDSLISDLYAYIEGGSSNILYEEVKPGMIEQCSPDATLKAAELVEGDILVFQKEVPVEELNSVTDPSLITAPAYFERIANRVVVEFRPREKTDDVQSITLSLDKRMSYEQVKKT
jgi:ICP0-binding domain of Ubiquitin-specific protease 7